ncbi:adenylate kinase 1 ATP binding protein [Fusarium avenaceum]|nr:adenylate kinase 1 ATP binding protein [Fusarium avenaceum]
MLPHTNGGQSSLSFAIVFVIGAPGAGKGTLSTYLAQRYNLYHYYVGDALRAWMRQNPTTELAIEIRNRLSNQGFVPSETLNTFIYGEIFNIIKNEPGTAGILVDGFPRCIDQLEAFGRWPFQDTLPLAPGDHNGLIKPDVVLDFEVTKQNAKQRYLGRARDTNDSEDKFERRFAEYGVETVPVKEAYQEQGIVISVDINGNKEHNLEVLTKKLKESEVWKKAVVMRNSGNLFLV